MVGVGVAVGWVGTEQAEEAEEEEGQGAKEVKEEQRRARNEMQAKAQLQRTGLSSGGRASC